MPADCTKEIIEYIGKFKVHPFTLCYGCEEPIYGYKDETAHCFIVDAEKPVFVYYCSRCTGLFSDLLFGGIQ